MRPYIVRAAIALPFIILVYLYVPFQNPDDVKSFIRSFGAAAPIAFIIVCIAKPVIFFLPSLGLTIVAGTLFGPWYGTLYVALGGAGSTVIGFYMTRWFGRKWIEQFFKGREKMLKVDENMEKAGFRTTLMLRLFSLPWDMVSYSAGLSRVKFRDFYVASLIALVPTSFIYTYFGSFILNPRSKEFIISLLIMIAFGSIPHILKRMEWEPGAGSRGVVRNQVCYDEDEGRTT